MCGFDKIQVCCPVSDDIKEMTFLLELYENLQDGRQANLNKNLKDCLILDIMFKFTDECLSVYKQNNK